MNTLLWQDVEPGIVQLTLNRPEKLNAFNAEWIEEMHAALDRLEADRAARVVILTGAGRGFCSGIDLNGEGDTTFDADAARPRDTYETISRLTSIFLRLCRLRQPVIAAINGPAVGAGAALALAADIRIASTAANFQITMPRIGLSAAECGISWLFPRLVGLSRAFELMLTGRTFDAAEAERIGLLSRLVPGEELMAAALATARQICANAPFAVWMTKEAVRFNLETPGMEAAIAWENRNQVMTGLQGDVYEAVQAFREKRPPKFS